MAVILAFILILWAWGRFESFATRTGHGNASKTVFLFDAYYVVDRYTRTSRNLEMCFQTIKVGSGLQNYYWQQCESQISKGFYC